MEQSVISSKGFVLVNGNFQIGIFNINMGVFDLRI